MKNAFFPAILIAVLGFAVYANSLGGEFVWDDLHLVRDNPYIRNWSYVPKLFAGNVGAGTGMSYSFYRPVQMMTYVVDYFLWGLDVEGYHLTNTLLHVSVALALFWFTAILFNDRRLALFTSLLFVVHPVHVEAVAIITGRMDSLAALFLLLACILYIKHGATRQAYFSVLSLACFAAALLSKEMAVIFPLLILLYHYQFKKKLEMKTFMPVLCMLLAYGIARITVLSHILEQRTISTSVAERIPGFFVALTHYVRLLVAPFDLHMEYMNPLFRFTDPKALLGLAILCAALAYVIIKRKKPTLVSFSIAWFFITLLPVSGLFPINAYMAEHWLYVPSIGFFICLGYGVSLIRRGPLAGTLSLVPLVSLLAFFSFLTVRQNAYWKDPISFYERTLTYAPGSARVHYNLGNTYQEAEHHEKALSAYNNALAINPRYAKVYNNLAVLYEAMGKEREAVEAYEQAIAIDPGQPRLYFNLGNVYAALGRDGDAIDAYLHAIKIDSGYANAYNNVGAVYGKLNRNNEAIAAYEKALEIDPSAGHVCFNLSYLYFKEKQYDRAVYYCDKALGSGYDVQHAYIEMLKPYRERTP
jgi:tetratricopeptide (TPR) repeat protein